MLLRRITLHVKQQNWLAVLLDFLIVVIGVFMGVQVANWNDTHKQKALYEDAFQRVELELSNNIKAIQRVQSYYQSSLPNVQQALETLRSCGDNGETIESVEATFPTVLNYQQVILSARDTELLLGNNSFLPFQNTELRTRLSKLANYIYFYDAELAAKTAELKDPGFLEQLETGPLLGSPQDNFEAIKNGAVGSQELIRQHRFNKPLSEVCQDPAILRKYFNWEEAVYFQIVIGQFAIDYFEQELAFLANTL